MPYQPYDQPYRQQPYQPPYGQQPYGQRPYNPPYGQQPPVPQYGRPYAPQVVYVPVPQPVEKPSNGVGTAGFVFSLISLFLGWIPYIGWALWFVGALLSFIGVFKRPKGLAIAGLILSIVTFFIIIALIYIGINALSALFT